MITNSASQRRRRAGVRQPPCKGVGGEARRSGVIGAEPLSYFVVYEEFASVFMVAISEKKDQRKVIATVKLMFNFFKDELRKSVDKDKLT